MRRMLCNIQKNWYKCALAAEGKKLDRLVEEGKPLTGKELLEVSRKIDGHIIRLVKTTEYLKRTTS